MNIPYIKGIAIALLGVAISTVSCSGAKKDEPQKRGAYAAGQENDHLPQGQTSVRRALTNLSNGSPIYLAIGGWNSCRKHNLIPGEANPWGMNLNKGFSKLIAQLQERSGAPARFIIACHGPITSTVHYVFSQEPGQLISASHDEMTQQVGEYARQHQANLIIIGHSYGGAFAMRTALAMAQDVSIGRLITIDGISPVNCPPATMAKLLYDRFGQLTGIGESEQNTGLGCQQSPREFSYPERQQIRSRMKQWQNYYQSDLLSILKADAIPEACNVPVEHDNLISFTNGHIAMGMYEKLWRHIYHQLISAPAGSCDSNPI